MSKSNRDAATIAELRDVIRNSGMRSTSARISVLQALHAAKKPVTHADLAEQLVPLGFDKATVYRNLMDLTEAGLVSRSELGDHVWRFELRTERTSAAHSNEHAHFVCVDCGDVSCLSEMNVNVVPVTSQPAFAGRITEVVLRGHCERCVK